MRCDALTLSAVRDELESRALDARIQKLAFPDETSLVLETYRPDVGRSSVLLSIHPEHARVQMVEQLPARGVERDTPFMLLARKHLRTGRIRAIRQPTLERVLEWSIEQRDGEGRHYEVLLIVEVMGRRSNLVLVDSDSSVMDALRRAPPGKNPLRPILPHLRYNPPPPQERLNPARLAPSELADAARGKGGSLADYLVQTVAGLSPLAAREVVFRAGGAPNADLHAADWLRVAHALDELLRPLHDGRWDPTLASSETGPVAYAPYPLQHLAAQGHSLEHHASISVAMQLFYAHAPSVPSARLRGDPLASERRELLRRVEAARRLAERRVGSLEHELAEATVGDELRRAGEAILANQWQLAHGAERLETDDLVVTLDRTLTPVENAQRYFARYRKAREATERVPAMIDATRLLLRHLGELETLVRLAAGPEAIRALRREVAEATGNAAPSEPTPRSRTGRDKRQPASKGTFRRVSVAPGWDALVGTSAQGNAHVTFDLARPDDVWLHARGVPGAHVILRADSHTSPPPETVERAAQLAAWHSGARESGLVDVDVAPRRHVRSIPHGPPGLVRYAHEQTLRVRPSPLDGGPAERE